jgi:hypothetical protein
LGQVDAKNGIIVLTQSHNDGFYLLWQQFPTFDHEDPFINSKDFADLHILIAVLLDFIN